MSKCKHEDWTIYGNNRMGYARCNDCGKDVLVMELFNDLHKRMESALRKLEAR